jgi:glycerophosphoryl diester phosphodiesterase
VDLGDVEFVGHRGCVDHNPEHTVRAFAAASERLSAVEVDLQVERIRSVVTVSRYFAGRSCESRK